ncbi:signal-regulatory protein beta-1-like isoform X2 [Hypanus sabinus]|uniref:signal-regulatory protein beta-1-like isoform X2 n=1 Tax=Hypanus sabinus TaxID=79690 RepID=UPI0028C41C61|nr:signal-regulatory protein beta-1-like isoform X2 [Hypanus sabinus]
MSLLGSLLYSVWLFLPAPAVGLKVNQTPSALTLLRGQTARIYCSLLSGDEPVDSARYYWTRTRDKPVNGSSNFLKNNTRICLSGKEGWLVIRDVTVDDSDTYQCSALTMDSNPWKTYFGSGTEVTIRAKPDVSLCLDPKNEAAGVQTLICVAAGFFPKDLSISWTVTGNVSYETEADLLRVNEDKTYNLSSRLRVTDSRRGSVPDITCLVHHVTGSVRKSFTFNRAKPDVSLSLDPKNEAAGVQTLICVAAGFFPKDLNISWTVTGNVLYETEADPLRVNEDHTYNLSSRLRVTDARRESVPDITCLVHHVTGSVRKSLTFNRGFSKNYFALLTLILIVPLCLWIINNRCCKHKNGKDSSAHDKNVDNQTKRKWKKDVDNQIKRKWKKDSGNRPPIPAMESNTRGFLQMTSCCYMVA